MLYGPLTLPLNRKHLGFSCYIIHISRTHKGSLFENLFLIEFFMIRSWMMSWCSWKLELHYPFSGTGVGDYELKWKGKVVSLM